MNFLIFQWLLLHRSAEAKNSSNLGNSTAIGFVPQFHISGLGMALSLFYSGDRIILMSQFDFRQFLVNIQKYKVSVLFWKYWRFWPPIDLTHADTIRTYLMQLELTRLVWHHIWIGNLPTAGTANSSTAGQRRSCVTVRLVIRHWHHVCCCITQGGNCQRTQSKVWSQSPTEWATLTFDFGAGRLRAFVRRVPTITCYFVCSVWLDWNSSIGYVHTCWLLEIWFSWCSVS